MPDKAIEILKGCSWNHRILTDADFSELCNVNDILYLHIKMSWKGLYVRDGDKLAILLNKRMRGPMRVYVAFHEIGHALMEAPGIQAMRDFKFDFDEIGHYEKYAHIIAAVALVPRALIENLTSDEIIKKFNYPLRLVELRKKIYYDCGF